VSHFFVLDRLRPLLASIAAVSVLALAVGCHEMNNPKQPVTDSTEAARRVDSEQAVHEAAGGAVDSTADGSKQQLVTDCRAAPPLGLARLTLRFRDPGAADEASLPEFFGELWRLNVPQSDEYSAGDECVLETSRIDQRSTASELPYGTYRFHCTNRRHGTLDPPGFVVDQPECAVTLAIEQRRRFPVRLTIYSGDGAVIESCAVKYDGARARVNSNRTPNWASPRINYHDETASARPVGITTFKAGARIAVNMRVNGTGRFEVGDFTEDADGVRSVDTWVATVESGGRVVVQVDCTDVIVADFVGVAPTPTEIMHTVVDEHGDPVEGLAESDVKIGCIAVLRSTNGMQWASVPVLATVSRAGFETLQFTWTGASRGAKHYMKRN